jgi:hypothetical protein
MMSDKCKLRTILLDVCTNGHMQVTRAEAELCDVISELDRGPSFPVDKSG